MEMFVIVLILFVKFIGGVLTSTEAPCYGAFHMIGVAENSNIWLFLGVLP